MKKLKKTFIPAIFIALIAGLAICLSVIDRSMAQGGTAGNVTAQAYSSGVTAGRFVYLTSAGVVATATTPAYKIVGVCRKTAASGQLTSYAPVGSRTTVTSGEAIAVGDLLTAGLLGKAYVIDESRAWPERIAAVALTAAAAADTSVEVLVVASKTIGLVSSTTTIDTDTTIDANSTGVTYAVTADATVTLPLAESGVTYTFCNYGPDAGVRITLSPNSADLIRGQGYAGSANVDHINTKTTAKKGDYVTIVGAAGLGWLIQRQSGTWTHE